MNDRTQSASSARQAQRDEHAAIVATFDQQRETYEGLLPTKELYDGFRNAFLVAVQSNWRLLEADRQSLWLALRKCAQDRLMPDGREAALVIFGDDDEDGNPSQAKGKKKVVYMPMIAGLIKLARNTNTIASIDTPLIYKGENIELWWEDGKRHFRLERKFDEEFDDSPSRIIGAVAMISYKDGTWDLEVMSRAQIDRVRATSRAKKGPWLPWYDEMSRKTVLRRLLKRVDKSNELRALDRALDADETMTIDADMPSQPQVTDEFRGGKSSAAPQPARKRGPVPVDTRASQDPSGGDEWGGGGEPDDGWGTRMPEKTVDVPAAGNGATPTQEAKAQPHPGSPQPTGAGAETKPPARTLESTIFMVADDYGEQVLDASGVPVGLPGAVAFANWFAANLSSSRNPVGLSEHNADNIEDASADLKAKAIIEQAIAERRRRDDSEAQRLAALDDADQRIRDAQAEVSQRQPAASPPPADTAPPGSDAPPKKSADMTPDELVAAAIADLQTVTTLSGMETVRRAYEAHLTKLETTHPEHYERARLAIVATRRRISPQTAGR